MKARFGFTLTWFCIPLAVSACAGPRSEPGEPEPPGLPYLDPDLPVDSRVDDLVGRMTLEEKVSQTLYDAPAVPRLGIPAYNWWNEALHGVARAGRATVFPQAIGLAATWDSNFMRRVATAISDEARAKHHESVRKGRRGIYEGLTFWSPNINIFRDPRWGRGMETFGEDPFLTGRMAVAFVRGMQGDDPNHLKTVATPKHFAVHSGPEPDRHIFDARVDEIDLWDTYLPAFRTSIVEGGAESVMCAYNRFRGDPACASPELLNRILRESWGFSGYVVSDCWAIMDVYNTHRVVGTPQEAAAMSLQAGTDLNCGVTFDSLATAIQGGLVDESTLDRALHRLFRARFRLGMFDPPERVSFAAIPYDVNDSPEHRELALEAARRSLVLLKNDGNLLPLDPEPRTIAVMGPNADDVEVLLGNYHGIPSDPVTPLEGIRRRAPPSTQVLHERGSAIARGIPPLVAIPSQVLGTPGNNGRTGTSPHPRAPRSHAAPGPAAPPGSAPAPNPTAASQSSPGLRGDYFDNDRLAGSPQVSRVDTTVDVNWWDEPPADGLSPGAFSVRWTGTLTPRRSGEHALGGRALGSFRLFVEDSLVVRFRADHDPQLHWSFLHLEAGKAYSLRLEYTPTRPDAMVRLAWSEPRHDRLQAAVDLASESDVVIMALGLSPRLEGEEMPVEIPGFSGGDRTSLELPTAQQELLEAVVETGTPVVAVLLNGSALGLEWAAENVRAILEAWYPGQAGGTAIAEALFGDYNPAGRLPVTFYRSVRQLPPFQDYDMRGRTYRYFGGDPLFPFGYGLSYTTFTYHDLRIPETVRAGESLEVSVEVENTGSRDGAEVVQLYVTDLESSQPRPIRSLRGFERVFLASGERTRVTFQLTPRDLSMVDADGTRILEPGRFLISLGGQQPGFGGRAHAHTTETMEGLLVVRGQSLIVSR